MPAASLPPDPVFSRRGACPSLAEPMATRDGLLVRLLLARPGLTPHALAEIAAASAGCGNGLIDVSARGNLQIRGVSDASLGRLRARIEALDILALDRLAITVSVLAGIDPALEGDAQAVADALRLALGGAPLRLAPKMSVVIDGGGALSLDRIVADLRLTARDGDWSLALAGDAWTATPLAVVSHAMAAPAVLRILAVMAASGEDLRAADALRAKGSVPFIAALDPIAHAPALPAREPGATPAIGRHHLGRGGMAIGFGLAFGQIDADVMMLLAREAGRLGAASIRPAPERALICTGLSSEAADALTQAAKGFGLIVDARDSRLAVAACTGLPGCASAHFDTRAVARELVDRVLPRFGGPQVHVSGCAKGCAHPRPADLTLSGEAGGVRVVRNGTAGGDPSITLPHLDPAALAARIANLVEGRQ